MKRKRKQRVEIRNLKSERMTLPDLLRVVGQEFIEAAGDLEKTGEKIRVTFRRELKSFNILCQSAKPKL